MVVPTLIAIAMSGSGITYVQAKSLADVDEAGISSDQTGALLAAQGKAAGNAFAKCSPLPLPKTLPSFTVMMELDSNGRPLRTWRKGDSAFAACVEREFADSTFFKPPKAPFYSSFEFTFKP